VPWFRSVARVIGLCPDEERRCTSYAILGSWPEIARGGIESTTQTKVWEVSDLGNIKSLERNVL